MVLVGMPVGLAQSIGAGASMDTSAFIDTRCYNFKQSRGYIMSNRQTTKKVKKASIYRSVASSSAIETGEAVDAIERKLKAKNGKYAHLLLAD